MKSIKTAQLLLFFVVFWVSINAQESEFYRFSFSYFTKELKNAQPNKSFFIKTDTSWKRVKYNDGVAINEASDWKIVDSVNNVIYGAFTEDGVYAKCVDTEYCRLKKSWMGQYYKPIWEIKMASLGFDLEYEMNNAPSNWLTDKELGEEVYDIPEETAEFPGGVNNMYMFISKSISYPTIDAQGKVFIQFVIQKNGVITNIEIVRGVHKLLDEEVERVISEMPNWIPARQKGKLVNSRYILPVSIHLN